MRTIIADSGATKADWRVVHPDGTIQTVVTEGINPVLLSQEQICTILQILYDSIEGKVDEIHFYAAGVTGPQMENMMIECFAKSFPQANAFAYSDMVAASRSLCGNHSGIACIMGTGSNSCFYDGTSMAPDKVPAGGFIIGDEGSGAVLGRKLLSDFIKRQLPKEIEQSFKTLFPDVNVDFIIQKVYREPKPSRFLASFSPFLNDNRNHPHINNLLRTSFAEFFSRNISQYDFTRYPVNIVGSIAFFYSDLITEEAQKQGMTIGTILQGPIEGLLKYHLK
ncbi:MAG: ATPase [Prevotellaceae bacterium]|jgi:N-acetylglucosamine kinase-like BadF-type ATPase|nr:ATPase [Prevotellaceae bacterium]